MRDDRDESMQGHCISGTIHFGDQGSKKIRKVTHRFGTSNHPTNKSEFGEKNLGKSEEERKWEKKGRVGKVYRERREWEVYEGPRERRKECRGNICCAPPALGKFGTLGVVSEESSGLR